MEELDVVCSYVKCLFSVCRAEPSDPGARYQFLIPAVILTTSGLRNTISSRDKPRMTAVLSRHTNNKLLVPR